MITTFNIFLLNFKQYIILKQIEKGSFGQVYLVHDTNLNTNMAMKIELKSSESSSIIREIKILKYLENIEGVPKLYNYGSDYNNK